MLILVADRYQEYNCYPKVRVALFELKTINGILIETLMASSKTRSPKPIALSRDFY